MKYIKPTKPLLAEMDDRLRALKRAAEAGDREAKNRLRAELERSQALERIQAVRCLSIFKNYGANAPDTNTLMYVANEELAQRAIAQLEAHETRGDSIFYVEGSEWAAEWTHKPAIAEISNIKLSDEEVDEAIDELF